MRLVSRYLSLRNSSEAGAEGSPPRWSRGISEECSCPQRQDSQRLSGQICVLCFVVPCCASGFPHNNCEALHKTGIHGHSGPLMCGPLTLYKEMVGKAGHERNGGIVSVSGAKPGERPGQVTALSSHTSGTSGLLGLISVNTLIFLELWGKPTGNSGFPQ